MSTDVGYELVTALRSAVDGVEPPPIDLAAIKRRGRRRRYRARAAATIVVVFAAGVVSVLLVAVPRGYGHTVPTVASPVRTKTIAHVRAFYHAYALAEIHGPESVNTLVKTYATGWYTPILQTAAASRTNPVGCAEHDLSAVAMDYEWVGVLGGQAVVLTRWRTARQVKYNVVSTTPKTAAITGITCVSAAYGQVTPAARNAPSGLYATYVQALLTGVAVKTELLHLSGSGILAGRSYFRQLAIAAPALNYDPVLCETGRPGAGGWSFSVARRPTLVAGGSTALIVVRPRAKTPILTVVQRGAQGFAVTDIACR